MTGPRGNDVMVSFVSGYRAMSNPFTLFCLPHVIRGLGYLNMTAISFDASGLRDLAIVSNCF